MTKTVPGSTDGKVVGLEAFERQDLIRACRRLCKLILEVDPDAADFREKIRVAQQSADMLWKGIKPGRGNPLLKHARKKAAQSRHEAFRQRQAKIKPIIDKLRAEGLSYREIGEELDKMGIKPVNAERWGSSSVRLYDLH